MYANEDVRISLDSARSVDDSLGLVEWLRNERGLHGRVQLNSNPPAEGELGGVIDLITVAMGSGGIATVLAGSLTSWLQSRRAHTKVRIVITQADRSLELETDDTVAAEALIRRFLGEHDGA
ncbi:effector-associated constant component EACC1 [Nocardia sp. CA-151230]|uniref:effector-associated constant component EACC1 n=1 Tax=Nocardia sp. CA-151230 TaxID=3239982 RepID=UPI003D902FD3